MEQYIHQIVHLILILPYAHQRPQPLELACTTDGRLGKFEQHGRTAHTGAQDMPMPEYGSLQRHDSFASNIREKHQIFSHPILQKLIDRTKVGGAFATFHWQMEQKKPASLFVQPAEPISSHIRDA